jgi:hypothetical protein
MKRHTPYFRAKATPDKQGEVILAAHNEETPGKAVQADDPRLGGGTSAGLTNINISAGTLAQNLSNVVFSNSNGVSFGLSASTITASVATSLTNVNVSAGAASNNLSAFVFSNSNNVSFGLNGSTITATATVATSLTNINISADGSSNNLSALVFSNANNVTFGLNGSTMTASASVASSLTAVNVSAGTVANNLSALVFSNANNVSFGMTGSTVTATVGPMLSFFEPFDPTGVTASTAYTQSVSHMVQFLLPLPISMSYARFFGSVSNSQVTIATSAASKNISAQLYTTFNMVLYTHGTGASSTRIVSVNSTSFGWTQLFSLSALANGSHYTITQACTFGNEGAALNTSTSYALSATNYSYSTGWLTNWSANRAVDIPFATSIPANQYWMAFGLSTSSAHNNTGISNAIVAALRLFNFYQASQWGIALGKFGVADRTSGGWLGGGKFSTAGGGTTAEIPYANISAHDNSNCRLYFNMARSA